MNDVDKIRSVVAKFFRVPESEVTDDYVFPADRLEGSMARRTLHAAIKRMAGVDLPSVHQANTFGALFNAAAPAANSETARVVTAVTPANNDNSVGLDIEFTESLPAAADLWSDKFYSENFTPAEIAHAQRQVNPQLSLCGIWAAKEAAIKTGLFPNALPLNFEVRHEENGKPVLISMLAAFSALAAECAISITHSKNLAAAVCFRPQKVEPPKAVAPAPLPAHGAPASGDRKLALGLSILAVIIAILSFLRH